MCRQATTGVAAARLLDAQVGRCLPQLLGAAAWRKDRPDSGPHQSDVVPDEPARRFPRPVRRVLRNPARQHAAAGERRFAEQISSRGWKTRKNRPSRTPRSREAKDAFLVAVVRELPPRHRYDRPRHIRPGPHALDEQADHRRRNDPEYARRNSRKWMNDPQQIKDGCLMPRFGLNAKKRGSSRGLLDRSQIELMRSSARISLTPHEFRLARTRIRPR